MSLLSKAGMIGGETAATGGVMSLLGSGAAMGILNPGTGALVTGGSTGLMGAATSLMTNPWTIAIGAGIAGAALWVKSQAHHEANEWVKGYQNPWGKKATSFMDSFWADRKSGTLTYEDAIARQNEFNANLADYQDQATMFEGKGGDQKKVVGQMRKQLDPMIATWQQSMQENIDALKPADPTAGTSETTPPSLKDGPKQAMSAAEQQKKRTLSMRGRASTILAGNHDQTGFGLSRSLLGGY